MPPPRNHVIDAARAISVVVVVAFHALLYQVSWVAGGPTLIPWAPPRWPWWALSWLFMVIPVFFVAGGFGHAQTVDRMRREGFSYGHFLASRGRRLVGPLLFFVTVVAAFSSAAAWAGWLAQAVLLTRALMQLLWFIAVYLVIVGIAPAAVAAQDRFGGWAMLAPFVAAAAVDAWSFAAGASWLRNLNLLLVWPLVHQFGIAYQRGWFRSGPAWRAWLSTAGGASGIAFCVFVLGYPGSAVGLADIPIANVLPPTVAMVFLALAQCGVLAVVERAGVLASLKPTATRVLAWLNALMMTVYLWHIGCIAIAAGLLLAVSNAAPAASGLLLAQPTVALASLAVVAVVAPLLGRVEYRLIPPLGARQDTGRAVVAFAVLVLATGLVWQFGTVVHPDSPGSSLGVLGIWAGSALMRRAAAAVAVSDRG